MSMEFFDRMRPLRYEMEHYKKIAESLEYVLTRSEQLYKEGYDDGYRKGYHQAQMEYLDSKEGEDD